MKAMVLIVDDEKNIREGLAQFLKNQKFHVEMASNVSKAIEILNDKSHRFNHQ